MSGIDEYGYVNLNDETVRQFADTVTIPHIRSRYDGNERPQVMEELKAAAAKFQVSCDALYKNI